MVPFLRGANSPLDQGDNRGRVGPMLERSMSGPMRTVAVSLSDSDPWRAGLLRGVRRFMARRPDVVVVDMPRSACHSVGRGEGDTALHGVVTRLKRPDDVDWLGQCPFPVVDLTNRWGQLPASQVWCGPESIASLAAAHLRERGFRHFAACGFDDEQWSVERLGAFRVATESVALSFHTHAFPWRPAEPSRWLADRRGLARWVQSLPEPVGIMAVNDVCAQRVLDACHAVGRRVPDSVGIVGVDDNDAICLSTSPTLSSVQIDTERLGYVAGRQLDRLMRGDHRPPAPVRLEARGVRARGSTDTLAIADLRVAEAVRSIRSQLDRDLTVTGLAEALQLSRSALERRFRKFLGCSPHTYLQRARLAEIRRLLVETHLPLEDIARRCGFKHVTHMCVVFKRETGETPGGFRREAHTNNAAGGHVPPPPAWVRADSAL